MREVLHLALVLGTICLAASLSLALVYDATRGPIAEQQRLEFARSLTAVLPGAEFAPDRAFLDLPGPEGTAGPFRVYLAGREGRTAGVAFRITAPGGYSGRIHVLVGVNLDGTVAGVEILTHAETPGLGSKIAEPRFKGQFRGRSLADTRFKVRKDGGDIDQITGATISPRAVTDAVRRGLEWFAKNRERILAGTAA